LFTDIVTYTNVRSPGACPLTAKVTPKPYIPGAPVGTPKISPVAKSSVSPAGRLPLVIVNEEKCPPGISQPGKRYETGTNLVAVIVTSSGEVWGLFIVGGVGEGAGVGVGKGGSGVGDGVGSGEGDGDGTGVGDGDASGMGDGVGAGVGDGVGSGDGVGIGDGVGAGVGDDNGSGVGDGVGSGDGVGEGSGVGDGEGSGVGKNIGPHPRYGGVYGGNSGGGGIGGDGEKAGPHPSGGTGIGDDSGEVNPLSVNCTSSALNVQNDTPHNIAKARKTPTTRFIEIPPILLCKLAY